MPVANSATGGHCPDGNIAKTATKSFDNFIAIMVIFLPFLWGSLMPLRSVLPITARLALAALFLVAGLAWLERVAELPR